MTTKTTTPPLTEAMNTILSNVKYEMTAAKMAKFEGIPETTEAEMEKALNQVIKDGKLTITTDSLEKLQAALKEGYEAANKESPITSALKIHSKQARADQLAPAFPLYSYIPHEMVHSTVTESDRHSVRDGVDVVCRVSSLVKYLGLTDYKTNYADGAVNGLLGMIEQTMFYGDDEFDEKQFPGLWALAYQMEALEGTKNVYTNLEEFLKRYETDTFRIFSPPVPSYIGEGELPMRGKVIFAVRKDAVVWQQLMPIMSMDVFNFKKPLPDQAMFLVYGCLAVKDPAGFYMYVGE